MGHNQYVRIICICIYMDGLEEGQKLSFDLEEAKNGKTNAVNLQKQ